MIGVLLRSDCWVASTIVANQLPIRGKPPKALSSPTRIVEIMAKPIVTPNAQPSPLINPSLKSFPKVFSFSFTEFIVAKI